MVGNRTIVIRSMARLSCGFHDEPGAMREDMSEVLR